MITTCPICKVSGNVNESLIGKSVRCKKCGNAFIIKNDEIDAFESIDEINKVNQHQIQKGVKNVATIYACSILLPFLIGFIMVIIFFFKGCLPTW